MQTRELFLNGVLIKKLRRPARWLDIVLGTFQEDGWPEAIDNPLPGDDDLQQRERLHNAVQTWNERPKSGLRILFERDGTGEGIIWKVVED